MVAYTAHSERDSLAQRRRFAYQRDLLTLIVEVGGEARKDKAAKAATARTLWVPAISNRGGFGRWAFIEISDPWDVMNTIRALLRGQAVDRVGPMLRGT